MLGEKRSQSLFSEAPPQAVEPAAVTPAVAAVPQIDCSVETLPAVIEDTTPTRAIDITGPKTLRTHSLFFAPENEGKDFSAVLSDVQAYISSNYSTLLTGDSPAGHPGAVSRRRGNTEEIRSQIKRYVTKYVQDSRATVNGMSGNELVDALYTEMAEYGFLTKYIFGKGIEEIDVNAWNDIEVQYSGGSTVKLDEHFDSPDHAINVIRRMLHVSGVVIDNATPLVTGTLAKNIRIAAMKTPLVDEDVGVVASIRIVNPQSMKKSDFVDGAGSPCGSSATNQMLDFLALCLRYGISICVAGATSSGKTTVAGWLLTTIPDNKRIFTIENGSRELALVREKDGKVCNSVIHTLTRDSENERQRIDQIALLDVALRFNPDILVVGEMRGAEANAAQEAARTGVAVLTTIHSNSCEATYRRMVSLCKRAVDMSDETLMGYVTEAYPLIVFCKQLENKQRKLMEIMECEVLPDGMRNYRTLFQFTISENRMDGDSFVIAGGHSQMNGISHSLQKRLVENGMPIETLNSILEEGGSKN